MALRLLLESHLDYVIAAGLRRRGIDAQPISQWRNGEYLDSDDRGLVVAAHAEGLTVVTFDVSTMPALLRDFERMGVPYSGVICVSYKTFAQDDIGGITRALAAVVAADPDLRNRWMFLPKPA